MRFSKKKKQIKRNQYWYCEQDGAQLDAVMQQQITRIASGIHKLHLIFGSKRSLSIACLKPLHEQNIRHCSSTIRQGRKDVLLRNAQNHKTALHEPTHHNTILWILQCQWVLEILSNSQAKLRGHPQQPKSPLPNFWYVSDPLVKIILKDNCEIQDWQIYSPEKSCRLRSDAD